MASRVKPLRKRVDEEFEKDARSNPEMRKATKIVIVEYVGTFLVLLSFRQQELSRTRSIPVPVIPFDMQLSLTRRVMGHLSVTNQDMSPRSRTNDLRYVLQMIHTRKKILLTIITERCKRE